MVVEAINLGTVLAALALVLAVGVWVGYRYALESGRMRAAIDQALARADTDWEDEVPTRRPGDPVCPCLAEDPWSRRKADSSDWDWDVEKWWGRNA